MLVRYAHRNYLLIFKSRYGQDDTARTSSQKKNSVELHVLCGEKEYIHESYIKHQNIMKRGIRNNKPLNIRHSADRWQGARKEQTDQSFVQFESMAYGYRAAWKTLDTYYKRLKERKKHFTVENIIARWAPPTENDTRAYIRQVLRLSGIGGKENLLPPSNVDGYGKLGRLIAAMTVVECGIRPEKVDM